MSAKSSATPQQMFFERASLQVLHHQEGACVRVVASVGHVDDVTATQSRCGGRLFQQSCAHRWVSQRSPVEHLDGHRFPPQIVVVREVDLPETTVPQQLHKFVAPV